MTVVSALRSRPKSSATSLLQIWFVRRDKWGKNRKKKKTQITWSVCSVVIDSMDTLKNTFVTQIQKKVNKTFFFFYLSKACLPTIISFKVLWAFLSGSLLRPLIFYLELQQWCDFKKHLKPLSKNHWIKSASGLQVEISSSLTLVQCVIC